MAAAGALREDDQRPAVLHARFAGRVHVLDGRRRLALHLLMCRRRRKKEKDEERGKKEN